MAYRIRGLDPAPFTQFYHMQDAELEAAGVSRMRVDASPGFPDRVSLCDMEVGDAALLLNYEHLPVNSPYRSCHAIFVREGADTPADYQDSVPDVMRRRVMSLRGLDARGFIVDADLAEGDAIEPLILKLFEDPAIAYIHAHYAQRGCFSGLIERA
jgi:hypothetical protein